MTERSIKIRGKAFAKLRNRLALTQREFGDKIGLGETRVRGIERGDVSGVFMPTFRRIAEAAGVGVEDLRRQIGAPETQRDAQDEAEIQSVAEIFRRSQRPDAPREQKGKEAGNPKPKNGSKPVETTTETTREFDRSVEPYSEVRAHEVPLFELSVAAGNWTDVSDVGEVTAPGLIDNGYFRIRLAGDSMEPDYHSGEVVEFRCLRIDREGLVVGKDYYIQRDDGTATFKRVEKITEDELHLRPLNRKKHPKALVVNHAFIVRMARAVAVVRIVE